MRYTNGVGEIVERFLMFIQIDRHTGVALRYPVFLILEKLQIDMKNCRGQSYDNAANMKGQYNGLQAHIKANNDLADNHPFAGHSLNLVGVASVDCCVSAFFVFCNRYTCLQHGRHMGGTL